MEKTREYIEAEKESDEAILEMQKELSCYQEKWEADYQKDKQKQAEKSGFNLRELL